jgi:acetolactate synthase-1/2/3 large subunit
MSYGLPAAIGCKIGEPDKIVIDIDGDASFSMTVPPDSLITTD